MGIGSKQGNQLLYSIVHLLVQQVCNLLSAEQTDGVYSEPKNCGSACQSATPTFVALRSHSQTLTVDWQTIRIQETVPAEKVRK